MNLKKTINKKLAKVSKKLTKLVRKHFSGEWEFARTVPNYVMQLTVHPWHTPHFSNNVTDVEVNLGLVSVSFSNDCDARYVPVLNNAMLFKNARTLSKEIGVPNSFALVVGTNPMAIRLFSFDSHKVEHYLPDSLTSMMVNVMSELPDPQVRQPVLKSKKVKKGKK